jgi:photosystem II stability/assembly factor-like uncharacterized protein
LPSVTLNAAGWTAIGPAAIGSGSSAVSGRVTALAADPTTAGVYYLGSAGGGVWKSIDAGVTWTPLTDTQTVLFIGALAVAPSSPSTLYAGTGEANNALDSNYGRGILKSTDGGTTWSLESGPFIRQAISRIVVDPANANIVYAAVSPYSVNNGLAPSQGAGGVYKSSDGGLTWTNTTSGIANLHGYDAFSDLVLDPSNDQTLYTAVGCYRGDTANGIYKSTDGGATWAPAGNAPQGITLGRIALALAPSSPQTLYASIANPVTGQLLGLWKTTDGGNTWSPLATTPNYLGGVGKGQGWYDTTLIVDPGNAAIVYAGGSSAGGSPGFIQSTDGGNTWTNIQIGANGTGIHTGDHALAFDATGKLLDGNDGGVWRLDNAAPGSTQWTDLNSNLQLTAFNSIALDPQSLDVAYGGSQGNGTEQFAGSSVWTQVLAGNGGFVRVDPTNPSTVYAELTGTSLVRSDDGGSTWSSVHAGISGPADTYEPYTIDPSNSSRLVLGTNRVWETTNKGASWSPLSTPLVNGWTTSAPIDALAIAPSDPNTIYATTGGDAAGPDPNHNHVFVTHNDGASWTAIDIPGFNDHFASIAVDPSNSAIAIIVRDRFTGVPGGHVFSTTNGGVSWTDISLTLPDTPTYAIAQDNRSGTIVYVGTDTGVFATTNGGTHWVRVKSGMPNAQVRELEALPQYNVLAAGTHGRGLFELATAHFHVTAQGTTGNAYLVTVTVIDPFGRTMTGYRGTVHFSSTDGTASLPADYTFTAGDHGKHIFLVTLHKTGTQTIWIRDTLNRAVAGSVRELVTSPAPPPSGPATPQSAHVSAPLLAVPRQWTATAGAAASARVTQPGWVTFDAPLPVSGTSKPEALVERASQAATGVHQPRTFPEAQLEALLDALFSQDLLRQGAE